MRMACILTLLLALLASKASAEDWPQWRGPTGQNHAATGATAPNEWSETSGLAWVTPIPGRGHSSPTIVGDRIYLTTCNEQAETQSLLVLDRRTGELLQETVAHTGKLPPRIHPNNTHASPTAACNGKHVFSLFNNDLSCWLSKFDLKGKLIWQRRIAGFDPQQYQFGFGTSPLLHEGRLVFATEYDGPESGLYAVDCETGEQLWHAPRPKSLSNSSPILATLNGKPQWIISGNQQVASYDPNDGAQLWSVDASTSATCGTMVWDGEQNTAFASGGYPDTFTLCVACTGRPSVAWENNKIKCYEQSLLLVDGYLYAVADNGVANCIRAADGKVMWRERIGGPFSASPLYVDGKVYISNERGTTFVFRASPEGYEAVAENQLGDDCFATSTPLDGRLYHRYAKRVGGRRQEFLAAIGE